MFLLTMRLAFTTFLFSCLCVSFQAKALEAEVINARKELEIMKNQHKLEERHRLKAVQVMNPNSRLPLCP